MSSQFTIFPAVDIQYGRAVQLEKGISETQKVFGDPVEMAERWKQEGAQWLHLVDLDAAFGRGSNADAISQIVSHSGLKVELTGGIRDDESLERALGTGCERINIGTAAVENPGWCDEVLATYTDRIAIALDVRGDRLATRGWTSTDGDLWTIIKRLNRAECRRLVVTDTESDGTLTGANISLLEQVSQRTDAALVASGGVASIDDIRALAKLAPRVEGVIVGTALYLGKFTFAEALEATQVSTTDGN
ncbi:MAG: bifunctional 1-(5-phosphoribosyl)-5-((5-phosphoribosylamino)methylideneamino)imidazole-4-carboxamide isomerase/phosphoribosylanthranilate isomerase PriA [Propionibacteriaceae bacterium]|jgi:phosphoribosylanthranilate isomerase|nr:bifunctional 1-(5-phosphoribosyl)-5-((5-phosphoribosylamino)methylideneamino)imidazole-4-carboxamide isomerase/phosphoribosylanthranilate isomerase PriA [Propionibacteriaceae bacterium]